MKTCRDCLHYEVCLYQEICTDSEKEELDNGNCEYLADRSEWVQVVKCENCKHCAFGDTVYDRYCEELNRNCYGMDFCSYGERKDERE